MQHHRNPSYPKGLWYNFYNLPRGLSLTCRLASYYMVSTSCYCIGRKQIVNFRWQIIYCCTPTTLYRTLYTYYIICMHMYACKLWCHRLSHYNIIVLFVGKLTFTGRWSSSAAWTPCLSCWCGVAAALNAVMYTHLQRLVQQQSSRSGAGAAGMKGLGLAPVREALFILWTLWSRQP